MTSAKLPMRQRAPMSAPGRRWANGPISESSATVASSITLDQTRVPVGPSMGRVGSRYLRGQVDKACLEILDRPEAVNEGDPKEIEISLVAELAPPYAVFLRNRD